MTKQLTSIHRAPPPHWVGDGFHVRSVFSYDGLGRELSPFLLLDYGAPRDFAPTRERHGVGPHPHRGFETVTVAFQGEIEHRDSSGGGGVIGPGDVQWMTAAGGIVHEEFHSERFAREGGKLEMAQLWVNLPKKHKRAKPRYQAITAAQMPSVALPAGAGSVRVIAGSFGEQRGPAQTFTPIDLWVVELEGGAKASLPLPDGHTTAFLVLAGKVTTNGREVGAGELALFAREGTGIEVAGSGATRLLVMSGEPIDEPIVGYGPFVMNTEGEIREAIEDFQSGRMGGLSMR